MRIGEGVQRSGVVDDDVVAAFNCVFGMLLKRTSLSATDTHERATKDCKRKHN